jgi:hypothetical protein
MLEKQYVPALTQVDMFVSAREAYINFDKEYDKMVLKKEGDSFENNLISFQGHLEKKLFPSLKCCLVENMKKLFSNILESNEKIDVKDAEAFVVIRSNIVDAQQSALNEAFKSYFGDSRDFRLKELAKKYLDKISSTLDKFVTASQDLLDDPEQDNCVCLSENNKVKNIEHSGANSNIQKNQQQLQLFDSSVQQQQQLHNNALTPSTQHTGNVQSADDNDNNKENQGNECDACNQCNPDQQNPDVSSFTIYDAIVLNDPYLLDNQ